MSKPAYKKYGFWAGLLLFCIFLITSPPSSLSQDAWLIAGVALLMALWWGTESIPLPVTALLPLALFPILGVMNFKEAASSFASPSIFLFLGGFILAIAIQSSGLHKRLALNILALVNHSTNKIIASLMGISFFISMWVMNTSTTLMLLPICLALGLNFKESLRDVSKEDLQNFNKSLLLGIAYASSMGGMSSLIGTAPNIVFAGYMLENYSIDISFIDWMKIALPIGLLMLFVGFFVLTKFVYPSSFNLNKNGRKKIKENLDALGSITKNETKVLTVFFITAILWLSRSYITKIDIFSGLTDAGIAIIAAISLFIIPSHNKKTDLLLWEETKNLPWGLLILFGGGLSLAKAINTSGLGQWMGDSIILAINYEPWVLVLLIVCFIVILTELTSNTATTSTFLPIVTSIAVAAALPPESLAIPLVLAASFAFMLPVATPPNAIVYASGILTIKDMIKAGIMMNLLGVVVITLAYTIYF